MAGSGGAGAAGGGAARSVRTERAPGPTAGAPYSQALAVGGLVFVSGQLPVDVATGALAGETVAEQTTQALRNVGAVLEQAGSGLSKLAKTTVFLRDRADWPEMNEAYRQMVGEPFPARSAVVVGELAHGARVEIEAVGYV